MSWAKYKVINHRANFPRREFNASSLKTAQVFQQYWGGTIQKV